MKRCRWCRKEMPDEATVCPHAGCGRALDPDTSMRGSIPPPPPPPGMRPASLRPSPAPQGSSPLAAPPVAARPPSPQAPPIGSPAAQNGMPESLKFLSSPPASPAPPAAGATAPPAVPPDSDLARRLEGLKRQVFAGRLRSVVLGAGAVVALLLGLAALGAYYMASVFAYAQLDPDIEIRRDTLDPDRLLLVYRPTTSGTVGFRRTDRDRDTELLDQVTPVAVGKSQTFQWRVSGLQPGDPIRVTHRRGMRLVSGELSVPERPPVLLASIYARRTLANRQQWIARLGGNAASEKAVGDGLRWLARHQADNGSWSNRCLGSGTESKCDPSSPCDGPGGDYAMALTGLALLAFQAGGHYAFNGNNYSDAVRKGLDWLVAHQRSDGGLIRPGHPESGGFYQQYMYEHGIATFALAEACAVANAAGGPRQPPYIQAVAKAIQFIYQMQHDDGGWRYNNRLQAPSDTSVTGWQVLALKSAKEAGAKLDPSCIDKVRSFFLAHATGESGRTGYLGRGLHTEATTGVGMLAQQFLLNEPDGPLVRDAANYLAGFAERAWADRGLRRRDKDYYLWYNCTLAMFQAGGEPWQRWNNVVRDTVVDLQEHGGCVEGSWGPASRWGNQGGRIYTTALAVLTLEVYYRYAGQDDSALPGTITADAGPAVAGATPPAGETTDAASPAAPALVGQSQAAGSPVKLKETAPSSSR